MPLIMKQNEWCVNDLKKDKLKEEKKRTNLHTVMHITVELAVITTTAYAQFSSLVLAAGGK